MKEDRRKNERRRWGRKVTYPFIDSDGVLVTKNRRRKIDRREDPVVEEQQEENEPADPALVAASGESEKKNTSVDISDSKVMELEEALQDKDEPKTPIESSIQDLENEILIATGIEKVAAPELDVVTESTETEIPEIDQSAINKSNGKEVSIELSLKGKKHVVDTKKNTCQVGRDPSCDIVVQGKFVSREHAKITIKDGKLFIEDSSFNGTYIEFDNGQKIHVSKDEQKILSDGVMSMGKPVDGESKSVIAFKINQ
ncbi:MAG: FHA domain-containing protein [Pseudomonadota bacterium]